MTQPDHLRDPTAAVYGDDTTTTTPPSGKQTGLEKPIGDLPFTGLDLLVVVGTAFVVAGIGFALRWVSTRRA